jgi:hypothetical protein
LAAKGSGTVARLTSDSVGSSWVRRFSRRLRTISDEIGMAERRTMTATAGST